MKFFKLATVATAVLGSTMAMAAATQPYQYDANKNVISNTTGAMANTGKTLFNTVTHPGAISAEIGTLGYGANIAWGISDSTELQAGWSGMKFDDETDLNSNDSWINYEKALGDGYGDFKGNFQYDVDFSNPYLGVQMRPMSNWLTVGTGVLVPRNEFSARLTAESDAGSVSIDDVEYNVTDGTTIDMSIENKNKLAPYATLGFRPNVNNKWGGFLEAGAAYMGKVNSEVNVVSGAVIGENGETNADFEKDAKRELNDDDAIWFPIVKAGVTYRF